MNAARPLTQVPISTFIQNSPQSRKEIGPLPEAISLEEGTSLVGGTSSSTTPLHPTQLQTMVVVGGGTAAAQVLHEMNRLNASEKMPYTDQLCIVADYDGWHPSQRGTGYINHQYELIAHYGDTVPEYSPDYADRATFSKTNDAIIQQSVEQGACRIRSEVSSIERLADGNFRLHFLTGNPVDAKRVILATGLGKDTTLFDVPGTATGRTQVQARMKNMQFLDQAILKQQKRTMTATELSVLLDQHPDEFRGKKFVVQGSFVPVDVVQKLKMKLGADAQIVAWINHREPVNFLEGHKLELACNEFKEHAYTAKEQVKISPLDRSGKKVGVKINVEPVNSDGKSLGKPETEWHELTADYYIYGLGADPELAGSGKALLGNLVNQLEPIYDFDQTVTEKPYQTVLGLEIRGANSEQGLTIIGGATTSLAGHVKHDFLEHASIDVISYAKSMSPTLSQQLSDAIKNKIPSGALIKLVNSFANSSTIPSKLIKVLEQRLHRYIEARQHFSPEIDPEFCIKKAKVIVSA